MVVVEFTLSTINIVACSMFLSSPWVMIYKYKDDLLDQIELMNTYELQISSIVNDDGFSTHWKVINTLCFLIIITSTLGWVTSSISSFGSNKHTHYSSKATSIIYTLQFILITILSILYNQTNISMTTEEGEHMEYFTFSVGPFLTLISALTSILIVLLPLNNKIS